MCAIGESLQALRLVPLQPGVQRLPGHPDRLGHLRGRPALANDRQHLAVADLAAQRAGDLPRGIRLVGWRDHKARLAIADGFRRTIATRRNGGNSQRERLSANVQPCR